MHNQVYGKPQLKTGQVLPMTYSQIHIHTGSEANMEGHRVQYETLTYIQSCPGLHHLVTNQFLIFRGSLAKTFFMFKEKKEFKITYIPPKSILSYTTIAS
jgi:hypothetical protein